MPITPSDRPPQTGRWCVSLLLACAGLALSGCETTRRLSVAPQVGAAALGENQLLAEHRHRVAVALLTDTFSNRAEEIPTFSLTVENRGATTLDFGPGHLRVLSGDAPVHCYSREELTAYIQEEIRREAEAYTGQQAEVFLQADASRVDPSAALANIAAAKRTNRAGKATGSRSMQLAEAAQLLAPTTIAAGATLRTWIKLHPEDIRAGEALRLLISFDGEIYEFHFAAN